MVLKKVKAKFSNILSKLMTMSEGLHAELVLLLLEQNDDTAWLPLES